MSKLNYIVFTIIIYLINNINGLEYIQASYDNSDCKNTPLVLQITSECSKGMYVRPKSGNQRVGISIIQSKAECIASTPQSFESDLNQCQNTFQFFLNTESNASYPVGYCSELVQFDDNDCDNILINSYKDGVCVGPEKGFYTRYLCNGETVKRYQCPSNCQKEDGIAGCIFDKELKSVSKCPNIKSKAIDQLIKIDGKIDVGTTTGGNGGSGSGSSSGGGSGASSTTDGAASTGNGENNTGGDGGNDGQNSSSKLTTTTLFYLVFFIIFVLCK